MGRRDTLHFLTLIVVPAMFSYVDRVREKIETPFSLGTVKAKFDKCQKKKKNSEKMK
jgi:hypothetical protein